MIDLNHRLAKGLFTVMVIAALAGGCSPISLPAAAPGLPVQTPTLSMSDQEISSRLDAFLTKLSADPAFSWTELDFVGSVLVAHAGKVLLERGYGLADRQANLPDTPQTQFRIASVTKQFTAMAVMLLQARGKIDVQDRICAYVSNCPPAWQAITLHHLLTHTSGIPDYYSSSDWAAFQATPATPADLLAHFIDKPLDFQPGENWKYSNSGYVLLGIVVEKVSGSTYANFLEENILGPLNMENTGYLGNPKDLALGYSSASADQPAQFEDMSGLFASGGLYSTVGDLYLWDQALSTDKLIPSELRARMLTSYASLPDGSGFGYGYAWFIGEIAGRRVIYHSGRIEGFTSLNLVYPDDKITVIVLSNQWFVDPYRIGVALANIVLAAK